MREREELRLSLMKRYGRRTADSVNGRPGVPGGPGRPGGPHGGPGGMRGPGGKPDNTRQTVKRLMKYVFAEKLRLSAAVVCVVVSTASQLAASYMLRPIINRYIVPSDGAQGDPGGLAAALVLMAAIYIIGILSTYLQSRLLIEVGQNSLRSMRRELFDHMQKLPVKYYDTNSRGDLMSRYTNDIDNVGNMLSSTLMSLVSAVLTLIGTFGLMLYTNVILTAVTVVMVPLMMTAAKRIAAASSGYYSGQQAALGAINGYIEESVGGQKVIKVFNHEAVSNEEFDILNDELRQHQLKAQFFSGIMGPVMNCSAQINYTLTAVVGGMLCIFRGLDIGGLTVFLNYSRMFNRPINELSNTVSAVFSALAGAERVFAVLDTETEEDTDEKCLKVSCAYEPEAVKGDIVIENVSFGYTPEKTVLKNISVYAHPGQKIAFVGSTGAGKTTVMNLLPRFYDVDSGRIMIDGHDIREYSRSRLRSNITMVLQDSHLFSGTIMENIRYGRPDATDEEVIEAAKTASAHSFIRHMPRGYQTVIDADGSNLSQGQRQLLNIARAAVSKSPILIMDEATSSVDTRTEKLIERGMDRLMSTRTTFIIAHRLSTVRDANAIMVLENGEIIERGTHEELLKLKGRYYELYTGKAELD